jgi:hypothetical protein
MEEKTKKVEKKPVGFKAKLKRGWKKVVLYIKKKYAEFMKLPKRVRMITYIWLIVLLVLLIVILGTVINNKAQNKYKDMEETIAHAGLKYAEDNLIFASEEEKTKIEMELLIDRSYMFKENVANKTCNGFAVIYFNEEEEKFESKGYINCKKYTTKGYKDVVDIDKKNLKK